MVDNYPLFITFTDLHIKYSNTEEIKGLINQAIEVAKQHGVTNLICLGDVFQSRQEQPLIVFKCFEDILNMIDEAGMMLYCIPGNHDKTNYDSPFSFLDQFQWHPAFKLMVGSDCNLKLSDWQLLFLPYYNPNIYENELTMLIGDYIGLAHGNKFSGKEILLTHIAFDGSINNDGSKVESKIKPSLFTGFYKVFSGHYHNQQQVSENIFHLPSIQANNFGEDNEKGFTIFYNDGSHELVHSKFKEYHTFKINLDEVDKDGVNDLRKQAVEFIKEEGANIRFKFEGSQDKVMSINNEGFTSLGIDVKKKHTVIIKSIEKAEEDKVIVYDKQTIKDRFVLFCSEEEYDNVGYGVECLEKILKKDG